MKGIVEEHGGTIGVESVVDKGTTFWVRLPLEIAHLAGVPVTQTNPPPLPRKYVCQAGSVFCRNLRQK